MMGETAKAGHVQFQVKGLLKSSWQPRFLILYSGGTDSHPHFELYDNQDKFKETREAGKKCDKKIDLNRVKCINKSTQKSSSGIQHIIEIQCKRDKIVFSVDNEYEYNDWDYHLNKVVSVLPDKGGDNSSHADSGDVEEVVTTNLMYEQTSEAIRFEVDVKEDTLSLLCGIAGRHVLNLSDRELAFEEIGTRRIKYSFLFAWLRKFGKQKDLFFFECGRKCPNGEGIIHCFTDEANKVHDLVTTKSQQAMNNSRVSDPSRTMSLPPQTQKDQMPSAQPKASPMTQPTDLDNNISVPTAVTNASRKHPGQTKQAELIPLRHASSESKSPTLPKRIEKTSIFNGSKADSFKKHGPISDEFTKELENKILPQADEVARHSKHEKAHKNEDLRMSKEKRKSLREEKKSKEDKKLEKISKKGKKSEKEGKKGNEEKILKGLFSHKKKEKEKSKDEVPTSNLYEEVDQNGDKSKFVVSSTNSNDIYDEAISPKAKATISEPVEYAQPYAKKEMPNPHASEHLVYSDVKNVTNKAWMTQGQEEEFHEEDYLNIKEAREMKEKEMEGQGSEPPPLPQKLYDLSEDTYNRLDLVNVQKTTVASATQNIYGTAGAKPVGKIDMVQVPDRNKSESEGSSGDYYEGSDEEPEGGHSDGYEATAITTKPALKPKPAAQPNWNSSAMYEEIKSPTNTSPKKTKSTKRVHEALYDEVS